jgi:hypothetical protein
MFGTTATLQLENKTPSGSLGKDAKYVAAKRIDSFRIYRLLGHAQKLLIESEAKSRTGNVHRTRLCHAARAFQAESIAVRIPVDARKNRASLAGVQTCGSIWACPVCAKRIATQRGKEISRAIDFMSEAGEVAIMISNTARHNASDALKPFKTKFKAAHRRFVQSRRWRALKAEFGIQHSIKAVEGTWGIENGWHYHQHAILFLKADALAAAGDDAFQAWVESARALWLKCLSACGLDGIGDIAFDVQADHDVKKTYLAKLGLEDETSSLNHELSAGHNKTSGGAKIWQLLERSWQGDSQASALYQEWVEAMSGDQWICFSAGLKELCGIDEMSDEDASLFDGIEEEAANETLCEISDEDFAPVRKLQKLADLLEFAATTRNAEAVKEWLRKLMIEWNNSHAAKENDRLEAQFKALDEKVANLRRGYNKRGEHPAPESEFWRMAEQLKQLKRRLGK